VQKLTEVILKAPKLVQSAFGRNRLRCVQNSDKCPTSRHESRIARCCDRRKGLRGYLRDRPGMALRLPRMHQPRCNPISLN